MWNLSGSSLLLSCAGLNRKTGTPDTNEQRGMPENSTGSRRENMMQVSAEAWNGASQLHSQGLG